MGKLVDTISGATKEADSLEEAMQTIDCGIGIGRGKPSDGSPANMTWNGKKVAIQPLIVIGEETNVDKILEPVKEQIQEVLSGPKKTKKPKKEPTKEPSEDKNPKTEADKKEPKKDDTKNKGS